jgi:hypothetical protein
MDAGIIYVIKKERKQGQTWDHSPGDYVDMCKYSISTLRKVNKLPITICTEKSLFKNFSSLDVSLVEIPQKFKSSKNDPTDSRCKFFANNLFPYDINIFIDADTEILRDPLEAYDEKYDIQGAREMDADWDNPQYYGLAPWFNTGFLVYKRKENIKKLFLAAEKLYQLECCVPNTDQGCLNVILFHKEVSNWDNGKCAQLVRPSWEDINIKTNFLDPRWNVRPPNYWQTPDPYILHMKYLDPKKETYQGMLSWREKWKK